jgi:hypothetical protein
LQAALLAGKSALADHIRDVVVPTVKSNPSFQNSSVLLRLYAHLILWMENAGDVRSDEVEYDGDYLHNAAAVEAIITNDVLHPGRTLFWIFEYFCGSYSCFFVM